LDGKESVGPHPRGRTALAPVRHPLDDLRQRCRSHVRDELLWSLFELTLLVLYVVMLAEDYVL
jgi:hypothetical protein